MSAGIYNFLINRGESVTKVFTNYDINQTLVPFINGTIAQMAVKTVADINAENIILSVANDSHLQINNNQGTLTLTFSSYDTENILGIYSQLLYDVWLYMPSGAVVKFLTGTITIFPSVMHV